MSEFETAMSAAISGDFEEFKASMFNALNAARNETLENLRAETAAEIFATEGVEEPAAKGERKFKALHSPDKIHSNPDEVYPPVSTQKDATKKASYENGEDKLVYESADIPQMKLDGIKGEISSSNPTRVRTALGGLRRLCRERLPAEGANDKIAQFMVDPKLMDQIESTVAKDPTADVRPLVKFRLKALGVDTKNW